MHKWQTSLKSASLKPQSLKFDAEADALFKLKIPPHFLKKIDFSNPKDPLLLQVLPQAAETLNTPGYVTDVLQEQQANVMPGMLHKYHGRVLFITSPNCAINCRYCFRREFPYAENTPGKAGWQKALDYIRQDASITEVILSGGDPFTLTDASLLFLIEQLNTIPHLTRLRFHTRVPVVMPERFTDELLQTLNQIRLQRILVIHSNHPKEIDQPVTDVLAQLKKLNFTLLNQAVLLKGVNDNADTLIQLSETLFAAGALPYYLHLLDKVKGVAHFDVDVKKAKHLIQEIAKQLPGYLVPKLVQEQPGMPYKTVLS